ncbi:MAG: DUF4838 domain-containing protein [Bacteroidota bacterium]
MIQENKISAASRTVVLSLLLVGLSVQVLSQVRVVTAGKPTAMVVTADQPTQTARYAADELVKHVKLATNVTLEVITENQATEGPYTRIYVGETETAARFGIDVNHLPREAYVLRSIGNDLFVLGKEDENDPLDQRNPNVGTLWGTYEFLEEYLGVRWLWPGELGTYVPKTNTIEISSVNKMEAPALNFRTMRWHIIHRIANGAQLTEEDERLGFSQDVAEKYGQAVGVLFRRNRLGGIDAKPPSGHIASSWWNKYSKDHPEWFVLCNDGTRGNPDPTKENPEVALCISNEELQDFIVDQWDGESTLVLGPIDHVGRCTCENCRAWDGPQPENPPWFAKLMYSNPPKTDVFYGQTSDRYAHFWKVVHEKASKRNPNVQISCSFLYENEFAAPLNNVWLGKDYYGEFVQWRDPHLRYFPMPDEALDWIKEQWLGWKATGIRMAYRPNYLHDGYVMPYFDTWQSGEFFKFAYENGMEGADFDSYTGQWAVQGLRLYMHMRLFNKPELEIKDIRDEYFSAFGPAAETVERYCDYWEDYAVKNILNFIDKLSIRRYANYPLEVNKAFPEEVFEPAEAMLTQALKEASSSDSPEFAERVKFLQTGLQHAGLTLKVAAIYDGNKEIPKNKMKDARKALGELVQYRKDHQNEYFSDFLHLTSYWEIPSWNMDYFKGL